MAIRIICIALTLLLSIAAFATDADKAPAVVAGKVFLDRNGNGKMDVGEEGIAGIRVTDSVNFVTTADDGSYTIKVADDPEIPFGASRVVSVSWPSGKWPSGVWWRRLSEIKVGDKVDFGLRVDEQKLPFLFVHIGDDHGGGGGYPAIGSLVKEQLASMARFCVNTGDLGYASPDGAALMFAAIRKNAAEFPVPMFFTPGNHDMVGRIPDWGKGPLQGVGAFTKYLGPIRWSFSYAGSHFVGVDWADAKNGSHEGTSEIAADWLERDLQSLPAGTRTFVFMHFPSACRRFTDVVSKHKVVRIFGGHNHVCREYTLGNVPATTTINLKGKGTLLGIVGEDDFNVVGYCGGCKNRADYHSKGCALRGFQTSLAAPVEQRASLVPALEKRHDRHAGVAGAKLSSSVQLLDAGKGAVHIVAEIEPGDAAKCGLRLGLTDKLELSYDNRILNIAGTPVPFVPGPGEKTLSWQVLVENGTLTFYANNLIRLVKPVKVDNPATVSVFAEGGSVIVTRVDAWNLLP